LLRRLFPGRREALPSSRITSLNTCPDLRPRWCPARLPWREQDCCLRSDAYPRLWVQLPGLILLSTIIHFSEFNNAACVLALPLLRTPPFSGRPSVRLPTWWLAFGQVGLEYSSHPLGNIDMFQEVSPLFSRPELVSARASALFGVLCTAPPFPHLLEPVVIFSIINPCLSGFLTTPNSGLCGAFESDILNPCHRYS
jgi:hypothetical protein